MSKIPGIQVWDGIGHWVGVVVSSGAGFFRLLHTDLVSVVQGRAETLTSLSFLIREVQLRSAPSS
jgi:hypothetical protein